MTALKWSDYGTHCICWVGDYRINLYQDPGGWFFANCNSNGDCKVRFQVAGGMDAAKPIAIARIKEIIMEQVKVWNDV